ncbi:helix-turn-helix domain-containing protein [Halomarina rubra]|uniref:Helix-turn-helix domain-containing protein n=1 Tax=Halomarina rubra TaxID=2071873 RepID=A0ABD6AUM0_9EURY
MKYVRLTLTFPRAWRHPMHAYLDEDPTAEHSKMLSVSTTHESLTFGLFHVVAERDPYVERLASVESVLDFDVTPASDRGFYVFVREETREQVRTFERAFAHEGLLVVHPMTYLPRGKMQFTVVGPPAGLRSVVEGFPEELAATVDELGEYDHGGVGRRLTARQREALDAALDVGYYDVPRTDGVAAVAERLDCAPSTASTHLRKAEANLVREALD